MSKKWKVTVLVDESQVRDHHEQGASDPATTSADVRDFFADVLFDAAQLSSEEVEILEAQEVESEV